MTARDDLAAAATIDGVTNISPRYRQSLRTGDGFVKRGPRKPSANRFGWVDTWEIWIAIPPNRETAETWLDDNLDTLIDYLAPVMAITQATPNQLVLGPNELVNGLIITGAIGV